MAFAQGFHCLGNSDVGYRLHSLLQQQVREELLKADAAAWQMEPFQRRGVVFVDGVHVQVGVGLARIGVHAEVIAQDPRGLFSEIR